MRVQLTTTINVFEVLWTISCLCGFYYNMQLLVKASIDLVSLRARKINSIREHAAQTTLMLFATLASVQFVFVLLGFVALATPDHAHSRTDYVFSIIFIMVSFALALMGYVQNVRREALIALIEQVESF